MTTPTSPPLPPTFLPPSQVVLIRKDLFALYRLEHGLRIQEDRSGKGAIAVSIATRLGWACSTWLNVLNDMVGLLNDHANSLQRWGIILPAPVDPLAVAVDASAAAPGPAGVNDFLLQTAETMSRTFCGLTARALCRWQGGVYAMVRLLSSDMGVQAGAVQRAQRLFPRILALEELLASADCPPGVRSFGDRYLWIDGVVYRELLGLLSEGHLEFAKIYARRIHGSVHHEKGSK